MLSRMYFKIVLAIIPVLLIGLGCSEDDNNNTVAPQVEKSQIRVIHASYDAPGVDVQVDGTVAISNLVYGESSGYAEVNEGTRQIVVTPAGATMPEVISAQVPVQGNKEYTVLAVNSLSNIEPILVEDVRTPVSNKAKVRFIHASPDAPAVDIKLNSGTGAAVFSNVAFKDIEDYVQVDAGSYRFVVTAAGATDEVLVFNPVAVQNNTVYTVVAFGTLDNNDNYPFFVRVFVDNNAGNASVDLSAALADVLVTHASPDAPGVDLLVDNLVVNSAALTFPNNTGYLSVAAGTRNIKVNASGTSTTVIEANLILGADNNYSVFAVNTLTNIEPLVFVDDLTAPASGNAHARFIHLSPDAPAVDITLTDGTVVFGNIAFKEGTDFTPLSAASYDLQVRVAGTNTVVLDLPGINLMDGKIYTVFAKGLVSGTGENGLGAEIIANN
jgi:hypothetical protein